MSPAFLLRADAGSAMGTGHVMRSLAVGEALMDAGCRVHLVTAALPDALAARASAAGVAVHRLDVPPGGMEDLAATLAAAGAAGAAGVLVDGYHFPAAWRARLAASGLPVAVFDDLNDCGPLHAAVVVNASPDADRLGYGRTAPGAVLLLGPAYAPLRRDIRDAARAPMAPVAERSSLLLTFGGSDPLGLTVPCLERLAPRLGPGGRLTVAVGGADPRWPAVRRAAEPFADRVALHHDSPAMGSLMAAARLAVSAAGTTTAELAALAVPAVLVVVAGNQEDGARQAERFGWCRAIDGRAPDAADRIADAALALWADPALCAAMADRVRGIVDGQGAVRIAEVLLRPAASGPCAEVRRGDA